LRRRGTPQPVHQSRSSWVIYRNQASTESIASLGLEKWQRRKESSVFAPLENLPSTCVDWNSSKHSPVNKKMPLGYASRANSVPERILSKPSFCYPESTPKVEACSRLH